MSVWSDNTSAVGDINGDGIQDFISATNVTLSISIGKGDGSFTTTSANIGGSAIGQIYLEDLNRDGILDIATSGSNIRVMSGLGNGTFANAITIYQPEQKITFADFNGDGNTDLVTSSISGLTIILNNGNNNFATSNVIDSDIHSAVATGDFNGDGKADIVYGYDDGVDPSGIKISFGDGRGSFTAGISVVGGVANSGDFAVADLNGDGTDDFLASDGYNFGFHEVFGSRSGVFNPETYFSDSTESSIKLGDLDGDGILDVVSSSSSGYITRLGLGGGQFASGEDTFVTFNPTRTALADFNGDGVLDILAGSNVIGIFAAQAQSGINSILSLSLKTQSDARQALPLLSRKLDLLSTQRGVIGAFQTRLSTAVATVSSLADQNKAAESRIRDTDVAKDTADLARSKILQQSGVAVLAQAKLQPQIALKLLKN